MAEENSADLNAGSVETDAAVRHPRERSRLLSNRSPQPHHKR
ncbi:hypothetical protein ABIA22_005815 [Sinorhizobium fredii]